MTLPVYSTGTVSVSANGTVVEGIGPNWSGVNAREGDEIYIDRIGPVPILEVTDTTHLVIPSWAGGAKSGVNYYIVPRSASRFLGLPAIEDYHRVTSALSEEGYYLNVPSDQASPDPSLGYEGQYARQYSTGKEWVRSGGVWSYRGKAAGEVLSSEVWSSTVTYAAGIIVPRLTGMYRSLGSGNLNNPPESSPEWEPYGPQAPVIGALFGLTMMNGVGAPLQEITILPGICTDLEGQAFIKLETTISKYLGFAWGAGTLNGGLDTGVRAANTTYHVWVIKNPTSGVVDALFSTSATNPVMPTGYTLKRRIGAILTEAGSSDIRPFKQVGGWFYWTTPEVDANNITLGAAQNVALSVPAGIKVRAEFSIVVVSSLGYPTRFTSICDPDVSNADIYHNVMATIASETRALLVQCQTNTARCISAYGSGTLLMSVYTRGWYDGRDTYV